MPRRNKAKAFQNNRYLQRALLASLAGAGTGVGAIMARNWWNRRTGTLKRAVKLAKRVRKYPMKKLHQRARSSGLGGTFSKYFYGRNRLHPTMRTLYKQTAKRFVSGDNSGTISTYAGQQIFQSVLSLFDRTTVNNLLTDLNLSNQQTCKVNFESCSAEVTLSNLTNTNLRVVLYDIVPRRDVDFASYPESSFDQGIVLENETVDTSSAYPFNPLTCTVFTQYWRIRKVTHILMAQGTTHTHRVYFAPNKVIDSTIWNQEPTLNSIKYLTCYTMAQVFGTPAELIGVGEGTPNLVTTTEPHIAYVSKQTYKYAYLPWNYTNLNLSSTLTTNQPVEIINPQTGVGVTGTYI